MNIENNSRYRHLINYNKIYNIYLANLYKQSSKKVLTIKDAVSLQYLKKEIRDGVHILHADKHQNFFKLALSLLMEMARHV